MAKFTRCTAVRADGARCWLAPGHVEEKHLVLQPGKVPSADEIDRVARSRPDLDYKALCMMAALEPVGLNTPEGASRVVDLWRSAGLRS